MSELSDVEKWASEIADALYPDIPGCVDAGESWMRAKESVRALVETKLRLALSAAEEKLREERERHAKLREEYDRAEGLLVEVYKQVGNHMPASRRHSLTPSLRDSIRDLISENCPERIGWTTPD